MQKVFPNWARRWRRFLYPNQNRQMQDAALREAVASKSQWRISQRLGAMRSMDETNQDIISVSFDVFHRQQVVFSNFNFQYPSKCSLLQCLAAYVRNVSDTERSYTLLSSSNVVMLDVVKVSRPAPCSKGSSLLVLIAREIRISPPLLPQAPFSAPCTHRRLLPLLPPPAPCQTQRWSFNRTACYRR